MIGMSLRADRAGARAGKIVFDKLVVRSQINKATDKALIAFAAYTMGVAKRSLGRGNKISQPGKPPTSRTGALKRSIRFARDKAARSVVIGPLAFESNARVPALLEYGGTTTIRRFFGRLNVRARYRARPFMVKAFEIAKQRLPSLWRQASEG